MCHSKYLTTYHSYHSKSHFLGMKVANQCKYYCCTEKIICLVIKQVGYNSVCPLLRIRNIWNLRNKHDSYSSDDKLTTAFLLLQKKVQIIDSNMLTWNREEPRIKSSRFLNGATVRVSILVFLMTKMSKLLCLTSVSSINNHGIFLLLSATVEMKQISVYHNFAKYSFYLLLKFVLILV